MRTLMLIIMTLYNANGFSQSKADSVHVEFFEDGNIKSKTPYKNGLIEGTVIYYHSNGTIETEGQYLQNKRHGSIKSYDSKGFLKSITIYDMEVTVVEMKFTKNVLRVEVIYSCGRPVKTIVFDEQGKLISDK